MLIQSKANGHVYDATLDAAATIDALGLHLLVARAGEDCFIVNHLDATAYVIIGMTAEEERALAVGYGMDLKDAAA